MIRIGINGFGRIGRSILRINLKNQLYKIVAINDIDPDINNLAYLIEYDSTYGNIEQSVSVSGNFLNIGKEKIEIFNQKKISDVDWNRSSNVKDWYAKIKCRPAFRSLLVDQISGFPQPQHYSDLDF